MAVSAEDGDSRNSYKPYQAYLYYGNYPLARPIYAILNDPRNGLPWGFTFYDLRQGAAHHIKIRTCSGYSADTCSPCEWRIITKIRDYHETSTNVFSWSVYSSWVALCTNSCLRMESGVAKLKETIQANPAQAAEEAGQMIKRQE